MELNTLPDIKLSWRLRYRAEGEQREVRVDPEGIARPVSAALELGIQTARGVGAHAQVRRVRVCPTQAVSITLCEAELSCDVAGADTILLSGYNSWTDTWERPVYEAMRGLHRVPRLLIEKWALDGSGDYRFTVSDHRRGRQHGFGYGYLRYGTEVLLLGSLNEDDGFTTIREDLVHNLVTLAKEEPAHVLAVGEQQELMSFALVEGGLEDAVDRWLALAHVQARPAVPLVGFSSWCRHFEQTDQDSLLADLNATYLLLKGRNLGTARPLFMIDEGYATVGDWTSPYMDRFPKGMRYMARQIAGFGMVPGLWMAPFVCSADSAVYHEHPDWLLRDDEGEPIHAGSHWNGAYALDSLNPHVREYVRRALWTATHDWGFRLLKLDFLYGACMLPHGGMNRGQLMADALDFMRASVPEGVAFDLCGVPIMSAFGRAEYCRVGCDMGMDWDDLPWMRLLHRERVSTRRSLANTRGRAHLDGRAFRNDPDVFFLRRDLRISSEQRRELLAANSALGGMLVTSDDVSAWDDRQHLQFGQALAVFVGKEQTSDS